MKVNLGCGEDFGEDLIGIDVHDYGQQHILDLEKDKLPFEDDSIDQVFAKHFIEHLKDVKNCLNECHRTLRKGGELDIKVPNAMWQGAFMPPHFQHITLSWFDFLSKDKTKLYGYCQWEIRLLEATNKTSDVPDGKEIHCILTPIK
jgi:2-polyprenyl-3-methyl-5-hydroxy-6-metoxy-1,4-benzoquinol methylase